MKIRNIGFVFVTVLSAAISVSAGTIHFALGDNGDPTGGGVHPDWVLSGSSYQKTTVPLLAVYDVDVNGDSSNDVSIELSSPTASADHLMLSGAAAKGITLDGNGSGGINSDEVLRIRFGSDVTINGFVLAAFNGEGESADYIINGVTNTTTAATVSGIAAALSTGSAFDLQLTNPAGDDAFRLKSIDVTVTSAPPPPLVDSPEGVPNIIVFLADDMGQGDTSAYQDWTGVADASQVHTPTMELLAERGVRFTDGHAAAGVCQPSRVALTRGGRPEQNPANFGAYALPKMLKRAGYMTYGIGKWHIHYQNTASDPINAELGSDYHYDSPATLGPLDFGYDHYTGTENNITKSPAFIVDRHYMKYDVATKSLVPNMSTTPPGYGTAEGPREEKCQQLWIDAARSYMDEHAAGGGQTNRPFFLYYASHANHHNYYAAPEIDGISVTGSCRVVSGQVLSTNAFGFVNYAGSEGGGSTHLDNGLIIERSEMVWENDVALSRLILWLENTDDPRNPGHKIIDNTLLIFAADNGANIDREIGEIIPHPNHGMLRGRKGDIWEGGNRIPFIASWPGRIPTNTTSSAQISLLDLYATFASIAGVPLETNEALHSFSMLDTLLNPAMTNDRPQGVYATDKIKRDENALRDGKYKLIWFGRGAPTSWEELYDLDADLGESTNLLGNPSYAEIEAGLKAQATTLTSTGRARPITSPDVWLAANTTLVAESAAMLVDGDGDGHYNLEELAFGSALDSTNSVPKGLKIESATTNSFPVISYKRRLDHVALQLEYTLVQTEDLSAPSWSADEFVEVGSPVPAGDGLTEWVSMSYTNSVSSNLFIRVRIDAP